DLFSIVDKEWKVFKRKDSASFKAEKLVLLPKPAGKQPEPKDRFAVKNSENGVSELTRKLLLDDFTPPCVVVDSKGDIVYIHGKTGKYLEPSSGRPKMNILDMAREGLRLELAVALRKAVSKNQPIQLEKPAFKMNGGVQKLQLT